MSCLLVQILFSILFFEISEDILRRKKLIIGLESLIEPHREKTGLRGFRPGLTQTGLYKLRKELEA